MVTTKPQKSKHSHKLLLDFWGRKKADEAEPCAPTSRLEVAVIPAVLATSVLQKLQINGCFSTPDDV
eukprot:5451447-Amphidinium_carterae.1